MLRRQAPDFRESRAAESPWRGPGLNRGPSCKKFLAKNSNISSICGERIGPDDDIMQNDAAPVNGARKQRQAAMLDHATFMAVASGSSNASRLSRTARCRKLARLLRAWMKSRSARQCACQLNRTTAAAAKSDETASLTATGAPLIRSLTRKKKIKPTSPVPRNPTSPSGRFTARS